MAIIPEMTVPARAVPVLAWLGKLDKGQYDSLLAALPGAEAIIISQGNLAKRLAAAIVSEPGGEVSDASAASELVSMITSLVDLQRENDWSIESIAETAANNQQLQLSAVERGHISDWLLAALSNPAISRMTRYAQLRTDYPALFYEARVYPDMRALFDETEAADKRPAFAVNYSLKIEYGVMEGARELFVSLDERDLDVLEEAIRKARANGRELRRLLSNAQLTEISLLMNE